MTDTLALLHREHHAFSERFDAFSPEQRLWRPNPDAWSAADVLEHLVLVERGLLFGLERQLAAGDQRRDVGEPSPEALEQLSAFLRSDGLIRVPVSAARHITPQGAAPAALRDEWDALPRRWRHMLDAVPEPLAETGLIRHPVAGAITARGAARFAADHIAHHAMQLARLREHEAFPEY